MTEGHKEPTVGELITDLSAAMVRSMEAEDIADWALIIKSIKETYPEVWNCSTDQLVESSYISCSEETKNILLILADCAHLVSHLITYRDSRDQFPENQIEDAIDAILNFLYIAYIIGCLDRSRK